MRTPLLIRLDILGSGIMAHAYGVWCIAMAHGTGLKCDADPALAQTSPEFLRLQRCATVCNKTTFVFPPGETGVLR
jgi:hypothetical protein